MKMKEIRTIKRREPEEFDDAVNSAIEEKEHENMVCLSVIISHPKPYFADYIATLIFDDDRGRG